MKCPNCRDVTLVMTERQGVEIDYCPQCRGVWLDRGELDKLIERGALTQQPPAPAQPPQATAESFTDKQIDGFLAAVEHDRRAASLRSPLLVSASRMRQALPGMLRAWRPGWRCSRAAGRHVDWRPAAVAGCR